MSCVCQRLGRKGNEELVFNRDGVLVLQDKKILGMDGGDGLHNNMNVLNATERHT